MSLSGTEYGFEEQVFCNYFYAILADALNIGRYKYLFLISQLT
jgi:hypothetical protein